MMRNRNKILFFGEPENSQIVGELKQKCKHEVLQISDLTDGLSALIEDNFDLVILYDEDAEKDTMRACRIIKSHREFKQIPLIYIAGAMSKAKLINAYEAGADEYLEHPVSIDELLDKIEFRFILSDKSQPEVNKYRETQKRMNLITQEINLIKQELTNQKYTTTMKPEDNLSKLNVEKLKGQFLKIIVQELRSPMSAVIGFTDILKSDQADEDRNNIYHTLSDASRKSKELLDIAFIITEIDPEKSAGRLRPYKVSNLIDYSVNDHLEMLNDKQLSINLPNEEELSEVVIDPGLIKEVVRIFVSNAIWFTPKNGNIEISVHESIDRVELHVEDTGNGFTTEELISINKFMKSPGLPKKSDWPGLRLAIAKFIMDIHHAEIQVDNNDNGGATAKLIFPVNNAQREALHQILSQLN